MRKSYPPSHPNLQEPDSTHRKLPAFLLGLLGMLPLAALAAEPLVAVPDTAQTKPATTVSIPVLDNDKGLAGKRYSVLVAQRPGHGTAKVLSGKISYTPQRGYTGQDSFVYRIVTSKRENALATVTVDVGEGKRLTLSWDANPEEVLGYRVYYGRSKNTANQLFSDLFIGTGEVDAHSPKVTYNLGTELPVNQGDTVCFSVQAYDETRESDLSEPVCKVIL